MKKIGVIGLILLLFVTLSIVSAQTNNSGTNLSSSSSSQERVKKGFECLEKTVGDCTSLTVQELALTILSTPAISVYDKCVNVLKDKKSAGGWGNIRDTALSILALDHAGVDTADSESWLLNRTLSPTDLIWYLEQDSTGQTTCQINYDSNEYSISIGEDKKISKDAGACLKRAQSNYWLNIVPSCYGKEFSIACDQESKLALLYKNKNSPTIYVLEGTVAIPASSPSPAIVSVKSKCFGSSACEYEGSLWAAIALSKTGHDIEEFVPYIVAMAETNKKLLPDAFLYIITGYDDYANKLIESQKLGNYWQADSTAYNKFYDTGLAILSIGKSPSEKVTASKNWLLFSQGTNGCWQNSVRDTAMILWALEGRPPRNSGGGGTSVTTCQSANFFCLAKSDCTTENDVSNNYFCSSPSTSCCKVKELKTCSEYGGQSCDQGLECSGNVGESSDISYCCTGECVVPSTESECEAASHSCLNACSSTQETKSYTCSGTLKCCGPISTPVDEESSSLWIWLLIIGIIIVLGIITYIKREALKLMLFKSKSKFKEDAGSPPGRMGGYPPRGPPPQAPRPMPPRPMQFRPAPVRGPPPQAPRPMPPRKDRDMSETFKKLQEISK